MDPNETPKPAPEQSEPELTSKVDDMMATSATGVDPAPPAPAEPVTPPAPAAVVGAEAPNAAPTVTTVATKRSWKKPALLIGAAVVVIAAIVGVAYAEVIVPNRPANVLMAALENSAQAQEVSYKGTIDAESGSTVAKVSLSGANDAAKAASNLTLDITASGVTLPVEARLVDKNLYVKLGDLSSISTLVGAYGGPQTSALVSTISKQLSNKWISFDSTLLKQAGVSCLTDGSFKLTDADVKLIEDQYKQHPFATITSSASDTVNGKKVTKYELSIDHDTAVVFGNSKALDNLSIAKTLSACQKNSVASKATKDVKGDHKKTPITVWVDKGSKHIVQLGFSSTQPTAKGSGKVSFTYAPVSISAPSVSTPAPEVLANLQQSLGVKNSLDLTSLLGGLSQ